MIFGMVEFAIIGMIITISCCGLCNVPVLATGIIDYSKNRQKTKKKHFSHELLPSVSIVVSVKNEQNGIGRLLAAFSKLNYPTDKREIFIVEDGSTDKTPGICMIYAKEHKNVTILHRPFSNGKPSALNYGLAMQKAKSFIPQTSKG
jgi:cellulose synthase/poly-beta-1,6-N-acetylglucosamine synthase-like glycosyltransferase